jgi:hypothetical protein
LAAQNRFERTWLRQSAVTSDTLDANRLCVIGFLDLADIVFVDCRDHLEHHPGGFFGVLVIGGKVEAFFGRFLFTMAVVAARAQCKCESAHGRLQVILGKKTFQQNPLRNFVARMCL